MPAQTDMAPGGGSPPPPPGDEKPMAVDGDTGKAAVGAESASGAQPGPAKTTGDDASRPSSHPAEDSAPVTGPSSRRRGRPATPDTKLTVLSTVLDGEFRAGQVVTVKDLSDRGWDLRHLVESGAVRRATAEEADAAAGISPASADDELLI